MPPLTLASTVCIVPNPVSAEVAGETVLMSLERNRCYGLGEIGSDIWSRLQNPICVEDLVSQLSQDYEAAPGIIEQDVLNLLTELAGEGLIQIE